MAGCAAEGDYTRIRVDGALYLAQRLAWLYVHGQWPPGQVDHRNRTRDANQISNLRPCTHRQNMWNSRGHRDSRSGRKGVHWDATGRKWGARIMRNGVTTYLGNFDSIEAAGSAYDLAATVNDGEFSLKGEVNGRL